MKKPSYLFYLTFIADLALFLVLFIPGQWHWLPAILVTEVVMGLARMSLRKPSLVSTSAVNRSTAWSCSAWLISAQ